MPVQLTADEDGTFETALSRGKFAGGAVTFKLDGLIQVSTGAPVELIAANSISHALKDEKDDYPSELYGYQEQAFRTALTLHYRSK